MVVTGRDLEGVIVRRLLPLAVLSAGMTLSMFASPARASFVGENGWFVFSAASQTGSIQVWRQGTNGLVNVTGTAGTRAIMHHDNFSPAWSPEQGAHVAFVSARRTKHGLGPGDVWTMSPYPGLQPTNFLTNITHSPKADDESPAWDFTGGKVVYSSAPVVGANDGLADIVKTTWTGRLTEDLTPGTASDDIQPAWSPRGLQIAFVSDRTDATGNQAGDTYGIWLMQSGDGTIIQEITADGTSPNWKSDGTKIAFVRDGAIWVMSADGSDQQQLTHEPGSVVDSNPVWSPDGTKIAFQVGAGSVPGRQTSLAVMNADGSDRKGLLPLKQFVGQSGPDWKPDCSVEPHKVHGSWLIKGTSGPDLICFEKFSTTIQAGAGDDSIYAGRGDNVIDGGPGDDIILGGRGNDVFQGGSGNDYLEDDEGNDKLYGGPGDDIINGGPGNDYLFDQGPDSGSDGLFAGPGTDVCVGDPHPVDEYGQCETIQTRPQQH